MEIVFGGDFFPGRRWEKRIIENSKLVWSNEVLDFMQSADLRVVNLETPLTTSDSEIKKLGPNLKCHPDVVKTLQYANIDLVTLANNHIYDFGAKGLNETLNVLDSCKIKYIGVGENKYTAKQNVLINKDIVFINYCQNEWGVATENKSGYNGYSIIDIVHQIKEYKAKGLFVCLLLHNGHEQFSYPSPNMVSEFRFFVESGADLIITHHSHFHTGYEKYLQGHIFYGLGNMLFDSNYNCAEWFESFLLKIKIENKQLINFEILPIQQRIELNKIETLKNDALHKFNEKLNQINAIIQNPLKLEEQWNLHVDHMELSYFVTLNNQTKYLIAISNRIPAFKKIYFKYNNAMVKFYNYFNCEAHNELTKALLKRLSESNNKKA